jgi:1-acyl-sn-glycerol-3-phosphate acyltransferase
MVNETSLCLLSGLIVLCAAAVAVLAWRGRGHDDGWGLALIRLFVKTFCRVVHRFRVEGPPGDPLPREGSIILVANHLSGVDPVILTVFTRRNVRFLMAREYYGLPVLRRLFRALNCIAVHRDGHDLGATKAALKALRSGQVVGVFPQGGIRHAAEEMVGKSGVGLLALRTGAPVLPVRVEGSPNISSVFRALFTPSRTVIHVGELIRFPPPQDHRPTREEMEQVTRDVMAAIAKLGSPAAPAHSKPF